MVEEEKGESGTKASDKELVARNDGCLRQVAYIRSMLPQHPVFIPTIHYILLP